MLVLNRKCGEKTVITVPPSTEPTKIEVTPVDIRGDKVRIGFTAPPQVTIHREEVQVMVDAGEDKEQRFNR